VEVFPAGEAKVTYVTVPGNGLVRAIDRTTHQLLATIPLGGGPRGLALFPNETVCGSRLYLPMVLRNFSP
jgi:YVTN family beta-propeller protein